MQLDNELHDNAWLTCPMTREIMFQTQCDLKYEKAMMLIS
jgi:putative transcriptional regulator